MTHASRQKRKSVPRNALILTTYEELENFVRAFAGGHLNLVIRVGARGLAKSRIVQKTLSKDICWIEGNASPFRIYVELYKHRDQFIVIDDVDSLHADKNGVRLLKNLCQTEPEKRVTWYTAAKGLEREGIPREFTTSSRVVIISNDWKSTNHNTAAVEDRSQVLLFQPTALEVHLRAKKWFDDPEIFDWIGERLAQIPSPSMRLYYRARELKNAGLDWKRVIPDSVGNKRTRLALELLRDETYATQEARAQQFILQGGGCRATYFNYVRRLRSVSS
ncbi:hypothetical protein [Bythopirellula goksoeyrii]|uniref:Uncharacterized protein n=1 Tax=Bythopirellula goksoeyrii TaxID=1400387 RepID=A0A5B9QQL1_9BACT|nr:hypothetical protein [Bythopirellula goksoeyrii]QEG36253.1 hypothetical protein Pr1d_35650 [Bythopirellula goksoeyrii]